MNANISTLTKIFGDPVLKDKTYIFNCPVEQPNVRIITSGGENVIILPKEPIKGSLSIDLRSEQSCIIIQTNTVRANILAGFGCKFVMSAGITFTRTAQFTLAEQQDIFIGENCMFAEDIFVSNTDGHPIYNQFGDRVNHGKSVLIGEHVWIGRCAEILKGSRIESGSIVGARSVVSGTIPPNSICVGSPAKVIKTGVSFDRLTTMRKPLLVEPYDPYVSYEPIDLSTNELYQIAVSAFILNNDS